jgi:hypothetical protein
MRGCHTAEQYKSHDLATDNAISNKSSIWNDNNYVNIIQA